MEDDKGNLHAVIGILKEGGKEVGHLLLETIEEQRKTREAVDQLMHRMDRFE